MSDNPDYVEFYEPASEVVLSAPSEIFAMMGQLCIQIVDSSIFGYGFERNDGKTGRLRHLSSKEQEMARENGALLQLPLSSKAKTAIGLSACISAIPNPGVTSVEPNGHNPMYLFFSLCYYIG
jgi:hypothetical protein